jgi:exosortase/archaeosortase family protein
MNKNFLKTIKKLYSKIYSNIYYHSILFLVLFGIILLFLNYITSSLNLSYLYSYISHIILDNLGIVNELFFNGVNYGIFVFGNEINIIDVCTGLFELCVFSALIFANLKINFKNKLIGFFILIILFFYFNLIRILTMIFLLGFANLNLVDVLHTIFFKIGFFIFFILFYYLWLIYSDSNEKI